LRQAGDTKSSHGKGFGPMCAEASQRARRPFLATKKTAPTAVWPGTGEQEALLADWPTKPSLAEPTLTNIFCTSGISAIIFST